MYNDRSKLLKVDYLFYKDFSKWLRRESLRKAGGVSGATNRILREIKDVKLSTPDIKILLSFGYSKVTEAVFCNKSLSPYQRYRYLLKYNITDKRSTSNASIGVPQLKPKLIAYWNKRFLKDRTLIPFDTLEGLIEDKEKTLPLVQSAVLKDLVESSFYDWREVKKSVVITMSLDQQIATLTSLVSLVPSVTKIGRLLRNMIERSYIHPLIEPMITLATNLLDSCSYESGAAEDLCNTIVTLHAKGLVSRPSVLSILDKLEIRDVTHSLGFLIKALQNNRKVPEENL